MSIVGPSGSGKSTLLNMLGALERPSSGQVFINGVDIFSMNDSQAATIRNKSIGFIFQSYNLINRTNVLKNVEFPAIIGGMNKSERRMRATKLLNFLGLKSKIKSKPFNLSGGEQQRVAIARSLMNNPAIILADEPTGNLDNKSGREIMDLLSSLNEGRQLTIIMVTHDEALARRPPVGDEDGEQPHHHRPQCRDRPLPVIERHAVPSRLFSGSPDGHSRSSRSTSRPRRSTKAGTR